MQSCRVQFIWWCEMFSLSTTSHIIWLFYLDCFHICFRVPLLYEVSRWAPQMALSFSCPFSCSLPHSSPSSSCLFGPPIPGPHPTHSSIAIYSKAHRILHKWGGGGKKMVRDRGLVSLLWDCGFFFSIFRNYTNNSHVHGHLNMIWTRITMA